MVWAIDENHRPLYYFPRECPRVAFWEGDETTPEDIARFKLNTKMVTVIESEWLKKVDEAIIYQYTFSGESFSCFDKNAGYYTSRLTVQPKSVVKLEGLLQHLLNEGVELRWIESLRTLKHEVLDSSLSFSMIRLRNAKY